MRVRLLKLPYFCGKRRDEMKGEMYEWMSWYMMKDRITSWIWSGSVGSDNCSAIGTVAFCSHNGGPMGNGSRIAGL